VPIRQLLLKNGGIAQLGERLNGIQEVSGSIPLISTNKKTKACLDKKLRQAYFIVHNEIVKVS